MTLALALSLLIGLLLGLLGGGGSILTVPMLVYALGVEPKAAILTSLVVVGSSSLVAIIPHARRRQVCWKSGVFFGLAGMLGAYGGGRLAACFSSGVLMALFGLVTLVAGVAMLRPRRAEAAAGPRAACPARLPYGRLLFDGLFVGALTGLVGVGGGFLIVPALALLVRLPMSAAVGTSLLVIAMNALAGLGGYASHVSVDPALTSVVTGGAALGAAVGGLLSARVGAKALRRLFGLVVVAVAGYVLEQSLTAQLLALLSAALERHVEFVLGAASFAAALALVRIGRRIHRAGPGDSLGGREAL
jgi:hypothetical protein